MPLTYSPAREPETKKAGIYLHIPFCQQACVYCNFHFSTSLQHKTELVNALIAELETRKDYLGGAEIDTLYFGGGTPSLLSADEINRITDAVFRHYSAGHLREVTLEANPDDLSNNYLKSLHDTVINRLSIGVQSFRDEDLQYMKRAHTARQADYAIKAAQDTGFTNLSIDLIYGTPGLRDNDWKENMNLTKSLHIPHFSAYALTVEEKTALHHAIRNKKAEPVDPAQAAGQFEMLMAFAGESGFEHYEISNFALPGAYAVHNTSYWMGTPYIGIGPSAHSFDGSRRSWNIANNALYTRGLMANRQSPFEEEVLTDEQRLNEYIMTSIRTMWGCDLNRVAALWGTERSQQVRQHSAAFSGKGWIAEQESVLLLTNAGKLYADKIAAALFI